MSLHPNLRSSSIHRNPPSRLSWAAVFVACSWLFVHCSAAPPTQSTQGGGFQAPVISPYKPEASAPSSALRVQEADIAIQRGSWLYTLHPYKGLTILDLSDPKNPKPSASLPLYAYPIEMFVEQDVAYLFVKDALSWHHSSKSLSASASLASAQVLTIDIRDPQRPKLLQRLAIDGKLQREGLVRKRGSFLYAVATKDSPSASTGSKETLILHTFSAADPFRLRLLQSFVLPQNLPTPWLVPPDPHIVALQPKAPFPSPLEKDKVYLQLGEQKTSLGSVLTMLDDRLILTQNALFSALIKTIFTVETYAVGGCNSSQGSLLRSTNQIASLPIEINVSKVAIFDLSDPKGQTKIQTSFLLQGATTDQFKQSLGDLDGKKSRIFYSILRQNRLFLNEDRLLSEVKNVLISVDTADATSPSLLQELPFGKPLETVRASFYDHKRQALYAITATGNDAPLPGESQVDLERRRRQEEVFRRDPLYAISLASPKAMKILSEIDGLSGDMNLFRPIEEGQYLLAVGRDTSALCTGFGTDGGFSRTAVSLIDIRDLSAIKLMQRRCITIRPSVAVTSSQINWDRDQAHKQIGVFEDGAESLISIPVTYGEPQADGQERLRSAVGLIRWDTRQYNPSLKPEEQTLFSEPILLEHDSREIQRTLILAPRPGSKLLINLSESLYTFYDLGILDRPLSVAAWSMQISVEEIWTFGDLLVEQIASFADPISRTLTGDLKPSQRALRLRRILEGQPHDLWPTLSTLPLPNLLHAYRFGSSLLLFSKADDPNEPTSPSTVLHVLSLASPDAPKILHTLPWPYSLPSFPTFHLGGKSNAHHLFAASDHGVLLAARDPRSSEDILLFLPTPADPSAPFQIQEIARDRHNPASSIPSYRLFPVDPKTTVFFSQTWDNQAFVRLLAWNGQTWESGEAIKATGTLLHAFRHKGEIFYITTSIRAGLYPQTTPVLEMDLRRHLPGLGWLSLDTYAFHADKPMADHVQGHQATLLASSASFFYTFELGESFRLLDSQPNQARPLFLSESHAIFALPSLQGRLIFNLLSTGERQIVDAASAFVWNPQGGLPSASGIWPIRSAAIIGGEIYTAAGPFGLRRSDPSLPAVVETP